MIIDPSSDVLVECNSFENKLAIANCVHSKLANSGGYRYKNARKPDIYRNIIGQEHESLQNVAWLKP